MNLPVELKKINPIHDYAAGLIHPYWARKPINVVEKLIELFSEKGDTVFDPFMGSGTTLLAALKLNRNAVGSDLNPLACLIVEAILISCSRSKELKDDFERACNAFSTKSLELYEINSRLCVEREFFEVEGKYANGQFFLRPTNFKVKPIKDGVLKGRIIYTDTIDYKLSIHENDLVEPIDFEAIRFTENTRIAVHEGVNAKHFFTDRNIAFINYATKFIENDVASESSKKLLKIFLSSLLPMLRLSDKKASSQWPYWRPKSSLTSRNPIIAISKREKAFKEMFEWVRVNIPNPEQGIVKHGPASRARFFVKGEVDLIVTDPPYADHAPYLEYSDLYWQIISGESTKIFWSDEIVKTNAVGRSIDADEYELRMKQTFVEMLTVLKIGGKFVFFYVDKNINHWITIKAALKAASCEVVEVIGLPKQRRSMKSVSTPGKTLDGDLIVVCEKIDIQDNSVVKEKLCIHEILKKIPKQGTYFDQFSQFISVLLKNDIINLDTCKLNDIARIL